MRFKSDSAIPIIKSADIKTSYKTPTFLRSPGPTRRSTLFEFRVAPLPSLRQTARARVNAFLPKRRQGCDTKPGRGGHARGGRLARLWQPNREEIDVCGFAFAGAARLSTATGCPIQAAAGSAQVIRVRGVSDKGGGALFDSGGCPPLPPSHNNRGD